ncbi:hypothetical protein VagYM19_16020 [Vibrio alginolyticus]|nr:hypothetical protein CCD93_10205 [Vibrio sp. T21]BCB42475.1 hypothetical protein Vag1382_16010 [Vibrio alginolyticus]BCB47075.1 hypothetical protein VagVIO5_16010 [Vibrio alginolyticus]BCB51676.1 hypothetical protein VagYM19_16020 [Vibrio alginolyticus]BCB56279.1 hypothetical protein VagYM4_16020 [Vibrio alginolyticus]
MIKFDISEVTKIAHLTINSKSNVYITDRLPAYGQAYIKAPKVVCYILLIKLLNALAITDFDVKNNKYIFLPEDADRVHELLELYSSQFSCYSQYLVILDEDCFGEPRDRFEFDLSLKKQLLDDYSRQGKNLDLLQVASGIAVDALSIRKFGGHVEVINRLGANYSI